jgi:hypothetical protein
LKRQKEQKRKDKADEKRTARLNKVPGEADPDITEMQVLTGMAPVDYDDPVKPKTL